MGTGAQDESFSSAVNAGQQGTEDRLGNLTGGVGDAKGGGDGDADGGGIGDRDGGGDGEGEETTAPLESTSGEVTDP